MSPQPPQIPIIIRRKLDRLHWSLRFYAAQEGIAGLLITLSLLFQFSFGLDRFFEFPLIVRAFLLLVLVSAIVFVIWQQIICRCFATIRRDQLATTLEHYVPQLNGSLITAVEWDGNADTDPELMRQTIDEAAAALRGVNVRRFFRIGRLRTYWAICCFGVTVGIAIGISHPTTVPIWFSRNILLSQQEYPRRSELLADGFQDGRVRMGRGDSFTLSIRANMDKPLVPESIRVRIGTSEVGYRSLLLDQFRTETREGTRWRVFSTTFPEMLETVNLHIRGADSTLDNLCVEVVPTPTLTDVMLAQNFPDYMQRPERAITLTGRTMIPDGTGITITATSTKPLREATAIVNQAETSLKPGYEGVLTLQPNADGTFNSFAETNTISREGTAIKEISIDFRVSNHSIVLILPALREDTTIDFRLTDVDLLTNRHPIRVELGIIKDQPPVVTARLEGIGHAITPEAVLPIAGEITDDNGLATARNRYTTEPALGEQTETPPREPAEGTVPITGINAGQTVFPLEHTFTVSPLSLQPDDKLILHVAASDRFNLDSSEGQVGTGQRWQLEIVTPERLKHLLETREITLRQRFEVIIGEVERTKDIMLAYTLEPMQQQIQEVEALTLEERQEEENEEEQQRDLEARKKKILDTINLEQAELGKFHISRMLRDTNRQVYDLTGIIESFRTIRLEMINNRIFTEDERQRIDREIMRPMQELINEDFPGIDELLGSLNQTLVERDEPRRPSALEERQQILDRFDATLWKMTAIRDKMASMESFNEAVELLRTIIRQQQLLRNETMEERNRRLRDLLE